MYRKNVTDFHEKRKKISDKAFFPGEKTSREANGLNYFSENQESVVLKKRRGMGVLRNQSDSLSSLESLVFIGYSPREIIFLQIN